MALIPWESVSSYDTHQWKYDVFVSFHGDPRISFTDHLYAVLKQKGIITFKDEDKIQRGSYISPELFKAIEESRISVVILSRSYVYSIQSLNELVKILKCQKERGQKVIPVYYYVDPSDVRLQKGSIAEAFAMHEEHFKKEQVQTWRTALTKVTRLSGCRLQDGPESKFINWIVKGILDILGAHHLNSTEHLVGIDSRVEEIISLLDIGLTDVCMLGIWGMDGIGKSTIARVVYERLSDQFEASCFLDNIRKVAQTSGIICLQKRLLSDILIERDTRINDDLEGVKLIMNRIRTKRILIVLDDVNQLEQLDNLVGPHDSFGAGSRIIITTRDKYLLTTYGVDKIYESKSLSCDDAIELFSLKAFKKKHPPKDYIGMSKFLVECTSGLPLALIVLGSCQYERTIKEWKALLSKIESSRKLDILDFLQISFDELDDTEKKIFLHIACFFEGVDKDRVIEILGYLDLFIHRGLEVLIDKSLIRVSLDNRLCMHDLLQEMGMEIVRTESAIEPGKRSRLWMHEDINHVLTENTGTEAVEAIYLELPLQKQVKWDRKAFSRMPNLKLLRIGKVDLLHGLTHLPNALRILDWSYYPSKCLPETFQPDQLVELNMCHSEIKFLWKTEKYLDKLKFIKLSHSQNLRRTPNFTGIPNLQRLDLEGCTNLIEVHPSVGVLKRLTLLNLKDCIRLSRLPSTIETESLEVLILAGCSKIKKISNFGKNMQQLQELYLNGTAIKELPLSILYLTSLILLDLRDCKSLVGLHLKPTVPPSIIKLLWVGVKFLNNLKLIDLSYSQHLVQIPDLTGVPNLEELYLEGCTNLIEVNPSVGVLKRLTLLNLKDCIRLTRLQSMNETKSHVVVTLPGFSKMKNIFDFGENKQQLQKLYLNGTAIKELLSSLLHLTGHNLLDLSGCKNLVGMHFKPLASSILHLTDLNLLDLSSCKSLVGLHFKPIVPPSIIKLLWVGVKFLNNLTSIDLSYSRHLVKLPDFTGVPNLEELGLEGCKNLIEVHSSVAVLKRLFLMNLSDCIRLRSLPSKIETESLEVLVLSGCSNVKVIPDFAENMQQLCELYLNGTAIKTLPSSIEHLTGLILLDLSHCKNLMHLPRTIIRLEYLRELIVFGCSKLAKFEDHETASTHEPEIELISSKTPESSHAHETKDVEISSGAETESVFSQFKGESQMSKLTMHVKEPIEPATPLAVSTSGTNKGATVEPFLSDSSRLFELPDPETKPISLEKPELLSVHGTKVMEKKGKMSIPETEIEIVPSQPTEEGTSKQAAGTSKQAAVEPMSVTMLPSGKDEIEIAPTDSQLLLEVSTYSNKSIECTSLDILEYMNDVTARRIGFHGSDEIGRTSVLKALISNPKIKDLFDMVIWVTVSRNWSTKKVQDKVLRQLSLSSEDFKADSEIAERLLQVLKSQQFLLILDDVWEPIDLNAVGIPDPALKKGCKMIFSTRFQNVCHVMGADREVQMEGLLPEEAWKLFQKLVGEIIDSPNIQKFARAIVQRCHGLPLLIIVTGRALAKENDALAWMHASKEFSQCSAHGIYGYEALIQKLKFSYNRLEGPDVKRCFLYCALFPEDQEISIDELVYYWIQEGLVAGNRLDSYNRGRDIVDILVGASLLQSVQAGLSIKMHYLIRDLASRILSLEVEGCQFLCGSYSKMTQLSHMGNRLPILEYHQFLSRAGARLIELPLKEEWEEAKMIFFMDNELTSLPERPNCPILLALFLQRNHNLRVIPTSFFDLMPSLTILNLSKTRIKCLPKSICKLTILEVLILRDCERLVQLPSEVGSLRRLVVLDLQGTKLNKLSNEISELASLRHLKVSFYGSVNRSEYDNLPPELLSHVVIRNLSELETLSIDVYPGDMRWNKIVESVIDEVSNVTNLTTFCCYFPEVKFLKRFLSKSATWKIGGLTEFKFVVGHDVKRFASQKVDNLELDYVQWGQCLRFVNGEMIPNSVLEVLTRTSAFCLDHHINVRSLSEFGLGNFNGLRLCVVRECPEIQEIIADAELSDAVFPILEHLTINSLPDLRKICKEMIPQGSFAKLRVLTVYTCPNLEFVFASSMVQCFSNLEELIVEDCSAIKKIVDSDSGTLPSLKRLKLHSLPNLVNIMKGAWPPLENISFYDCPMLKKLGIDSNLIQTIKEIKAETDWWEELEWQDSSLYSRLQARFTVISDEDL